MNPIVIRAGADFPTHPNCNTASFSARAAFSMLKRSFKSLDRRASGCCGSTTERYLRGPDRQFTRLVVHLFSGEADVVDRDSNNRSWLTRHIAARLGVLAALVLVVAGCSSSEDESPSSSPDVDARSSTTTTTAPSSSTSTSSTTESTLETEPKPEGGSVDDEIISRYIGYWDARFAANSGTPNPEDPALREYATGEQLKAVIAETQANLDQGLSFRKRSDPAGIRTVDVIEVDGDRATVQECVVDDGLVVRTVDDQIVNDTIATHNVRGVLLRVDGEWRVAEARLVQRWEGVAGCANAS